MEPDAGVWSFYISVDSDAVDVVKTEIGLFLEEGHEAGYVTHEKKVAMDASDKKPV